MLNNLNLSSDERPRRLYVATTRAPEELAIHLTHSALWLDYFINRQPQIAQLRSGDTLNVKEDECLDGNGNPC